MILVVKPKHWTKVKKKKGFCPVLGHDPPQKEEHREHEELIPPCETGRIINYAVLEEGDSTINYLSPQYDGGEHVPHVPYVPFMINFSPRCLTLTKKRGDI